MIPTKVKDRKLVEKKREQIVFAAIKLFSKKGFHKTTLRELAEEAGISHGNIYDYVGNKDDILFLIHDFMANLADDSLSDSVQKVEDPLEKLRRMVRTEFNLMYKWADAILLIYQEGHLLKNGLLKKFLSRERQHVSRFETVLEECVAKDVCRYMDCRVVANLIKTMIDAWVLKRWDLRTQTTQLEMEKAILDLAFYGLLSDGNHEKNSMLAMEGKTGLILNAGSTLGRAICQFLHSKGVKLAIHGELMRMPNDSDHFGLFDGKENVRVYSINDYGHMTEGFIKRIAKEFGLFDVIIQDIGAYYKNSWGRQNQKKLTKSLLQNFRSAQEIAYCIGENMTTYGSGRVLFLAPSEGEKRAVPLTCESVNGGIIRLTRALATKLASSRINVNCIVPGFIGQTERVAVEGKEAHSVTQHIPLGYLGEMPDILEAVYFFVSDASKYVTGQVLEVAGGLRD